MTDTSLLTDEQLITATREGSTEAYAELWNRHSIGAIVAARAFTRGVDAEDLVTEAYANILETIRRGKGPTDEFFPYLVTTVRNLARKWGKSRVEDTSDSLELLADEDTATHEEDATSRLANQRLMQMAFTSLTPKEQELLWLIEVNGYKPAEIADQLEMTTNAISVSLFRAKESLRQAWIQAHLNSANTSPTCGWTIERLGSYTRGKLRAKDSIIVAEHLDRCARCSSILVEAQSVAASLHSHLAPVALAAGGSLALAAWPAAEGGAWAASATAASTTTLGAAGVSAAKTTTLVTGGILAAAAITAAVLLPPIIQTEAGFTGVSQASAPPAEADDTTGQGPQNSSAAAASVRYQTPTSSTPAGSHTPYTESEYQASFFPFAVPPAPTFNFEPGAAFGSSDPTVSGDALPGADVRVFFSGEGVALTTMTALANEAGGWSVQLSNIPNGTYTVRAVQSDAEERRSPAATTTIEVSSGAAADAPVITSIDTDNGRLSPLVAGTGIPGATVSVALNDLANTSVVSQDGTWSVTTNRGALAGINVLTATQINPLTGVLSAPTEEALVPLSAPQARLSERSAGGASIRLKSEPGSTVVVAFGPRYQHVVNPTKDLNNIRVSLAGTEMTGSDTLRVVTYYTNADGSRQGPRSLGIEPRL